MYIERNGSRFELTEEELGRAYWEQLRKYRTNELIDYLQFWADEGGYNKTLTAEKAEEILEKLNSDSTLLDQVAARYEKYEMEYPDGETEADCVYCSLIYHKLV